MAKTTNNDEEDTNMLSSTSKTTNQQNAQAHWFTPEQTKTAKSKEGAKNEKTIDTKPKKKFLPKQYRKLESWRSLAEESSDDEESERKKRAAKTKA